MQKLSNAYRIAILVLAALLLAYVIASIYYSTGQWYWMEYGSGYFSSPRGIITFLVTMIVGLAYIGTRKK